jgi:exopolysaccharide biosynthesis polyprenyl glycosylphosphotransferase
MEPLSYRVTLRVAKILNILLVTVPVVLACLLCYGQTEGLPNRWQNLCLVMAVFMVLYVTYGRIYGSFYISMVRISEMVYSQCLAMIMSDGLLYLVLCLVCRGFVSLWPMAAALAAQVILSVSWCVTAHIWYYRTYPPKKTAIVYDNGESVDALIGAYGLRKKYNVLRSVDVRRCIESGCEDLRNMETVFLCGVHSGDRNRILKFCVEQNITAYVIPRIGDILMSGAKRVNLFHLPFFRVDRYDPSPEYLLFKRLFDVVVSLTALVVLSPVMLVTAAAVKLTDGGPVFYRQKRMTRNGKEFYVLKFRSMRQDAEKDGVARLSTGDLDPRITPVGRVIRKLRIDELPQLFNILGGSMSIVGPRPERPEIAAQYEKELPEFSLRLQAKAGLTGYAQVYGKYNTTPYNKLQMDLIYIAHPSFFEDLRIIFATIKILFLPESTEGVAEGMETAMSKDRSDTEVGV